MKRLSIIAILVGILAVAGSAQFSPTNRIVRPCASSTTPASVTISAAGAITLTPCSGQTVTIRSTLYDWSNASNGVTTWSLRRTVTAGGTTGNQTINLMNGTVNFAAAATALTVTNSTVTASSIILATARTNDSTCSVKNIVPGSGSFVINMTAACTAETSVGFLVLN